jgi:two-component system chemotaxis response regulator CheY
MKVLIIDDSTVMRRIVEHALREAALPLGEVMHAANGAEGIAALEKAAAAGCAIDLVLCDVHMPVLDGLGFLRERQSRRLSPDALVVMVTANSSDPLLLEAASAGAHSFISKPFGPDQIHDRIAALLGGAPSKQ